MSLNFYETLISFFEIHNFLKEETNINFDISQLKCYIQKYNKLLRKIKKSIINIEYYELNISNINSLNNNIIFEKSNINIPIDNIYTFINSYSEKESIIFNTTYGIHLLYLKHITKTKTINYMYLLDSTKKTGYQIYEYLQKNNKALFQNIQNYIIDNNILSFKCLLEIKNKSYSIEYLIYNLINNIDLTNDINIYIYGITYDKKNWIYNDLPKINNLKNLFILMSNLDISYNNIIINNNKLYLYYILKIEKLNLKIIESDFILKFKLESINYSFEFDNIYILFSNIINLEITNYIRKINNNKIILFNPYLNIEYIYNLYKNPSLFLEKYINCNNYIILNNHLIHNNNIYTYLLYYHLKDKYMNNDTINQLILKNSILNILNVFIEFKNINNISEKEYINSNSNLIIQYKICFEKLKNIKIKLLNL